MSEESKRLMRGVRNILRITKIVQQVCEENGLTLAQYRTISWVCRKSKARPFSLAEEAAVSRPAVAVMVNGLVKKKLIKRAAVAQDGRGVYLEPLPKTGMLLEDIEKQIVEKLRAIFGESVELIAVLGIASTIDDALDAQLQKDAQSMFP